MPDDEFRHIKLPDGCLLMAGTIPLKMALAIAEADPGIIPELEAQLGGSHCEPVHFQGPPLIAPSFQGMSPLSSIFPLAPLPPDPAVRQLNTAVSLVSLFLRLRFNMAARKMDRRQHGESWQTGDTMEQVETLSPFEQRLYDTCLERLNRYVGSDPPEGG
jgi:hypothetical protein